MNYVRYEEAFDRDWDEGGRRVSKAHLDSD